MLKVERWKLRMSVHAKTHHTSDRVQRRERSEPKGQRQPRKDRSRHLSAAEVKAIKQRFFDALNKIPGLKYSFRPDGKLYLRFAPELREEMIREIRKYRARRMTVIEKKSLTADEAFADLHEKYGKAGTLLRGARARLGMTQEKLEELSGVKQGDISKIEAGKRPIGKTVAKRLAKALDIDYRVLL